MKSKEKYTIEMFAKYGLLRFTKHARLRLEERDIAPQNIVEGIMMKNSKFKHLCYKKDDINTLNSINSIDIMNSEKKDIFIRVILSLETSKAGGHDVKVITAYPLKRQFI